MQHAIVSFVVSCVSGAVVPSLIISDELKVTVSYMFEDRGHLDTSTGVMTISGLLHNDSNSYTPEINNRRLTPVSLVVLCKWINQTVFSLSSKTESV